MIVNGCLDLSSLKAVLSHTLESPWKNTYVVLKDQVKSPECMMNSLS